MAKRCAAESDHISRGAVDIQLTTRGKVESGLDMCRSAGFQTGWSRNFDKREGLHLPVRWNVRFENEVRAGREQRYERAVEIDPKWPVGVPWVITNTLPVGTDLVWINERAVEFVAEPQNLVSNEDNQVAIGRTHVRCFTLRNWDVSFG